MKLSTSQLHSLLLVAGVTTAVLASTHEQRSTSHEQASSHQLEARDPHFGLLGGIINDVNGILGGIGHGHASVRIPARNWKCSGSGQDGFSVDIYGHGRPSWVPSSGWAYFGVEIGWAPTANWQCGSSYRFHSEFLSKVHLVRWWTPSVGWRKQNAGIDLGISIPSFWGMLPSSKWKCNGSGKDGFSVDVHGNGRPSWVPSSGWAYFGVEIGWAPTASWTCSSSFQLPSAFLSNAHLVTWWTPSIGWKQHNAGIDLGITIPSFWGMLPSSNWKCNGSGKDGFSVDIHGNGRPSWVPSSGWAYFGVEIGWTPTASWTCSSSFQLPSAFLSNAHLVTWWTPSVAWKKHNAGIDLGITIPSFWGMLPSSNWKCNGSGKDGFSVDIHGNGRPSWVPSSGWAYFGVSVGWAPISGWTCGSDWKIPSGFLGNAGLVSWWTPPQPWIVKHRGSHWSYSQLPPSHWGCDVSSSSSSIIRTTSVAATTTSRVVKTTTTAKPKTTTTSKMVKSTTTAKATTTTQKPKTTTTQKPKTTSSAGSHADKTVTVTKTISVNVPGSSQCAY